MPRSGQAKRVSAPHLHAGTSNAIATILPVHCIAAIRQWVVGTAPGPLAFHELVVAKILPSMMFLLLFNRG